jgi:hypothetical protein
MLPEDRGGTSIGHAVISEAPPKVVPVTQDDHQSQAPAGPRPPLQPLAVDTVRIVLAGTALFGVALLVTLLVPTLHSGERDWWPWACVSGLALGLIGLLYIARGRGNAAGARRRDR